MKEYKINNRNYNKNTNNKLTGWFDSEYLR